MIDMINIECKMERRKMKRVWNNGIKYIEYNILYDIYKTSSLFFSFLNSAQYIICYIQCI